MTSSAASTETEQTQDDPAEQVATMLDRALAYARGQSYTGWDYGDGMSSRIRAALPLESKWVNIAFQEAVKRAPINIRPLLLVEQSRSYQGAALFAMVNQTTAALAGEWANDTNLFTPIDYEKEAESLAAWLVANATDGYSGYCAGFPHPIQHLDGRGAPREPDIVNTAFGAKALLRAGEFDTKYPEIARTSVDFVESNLNYRPAGTGRGAVIDYHTKHPQDYYTINAGALCARMFIDLYAAFDEPDYRDSARELFDHIVDLQTDRGGWKYRDPPEASHLSMDTHHNGFIIQCLQRYRDVTDDTRYDTSLDAALTFFKNELFEPTGAPNFDENHQYPRDINAASQGVLVFTYAGDFAFARQILAWVFENLYAGGGRFYFRQERLFTRRVTLMRWCQAWLAFAMSEYLAARKANGESGSANTFAATGTGLPHRE